MIQRKIENVTRHPLKPGFMGTGHKAAQVVGGQGFDYTDPFIALMDDQLDLPGTEIAGGPHPHAGFETVTLIVESNDDMFQKGSMEMMTAGKGVIHTEEITKKTQARILQLWLTLPPDKRWTQPFLQEIDLPNVPVFKTDGSEIRVYSGSAFGLTSPIKNNTPVTIVDFSLTKNVITTQQIPASYNGFIFVLEGSVFVGDTGIKKGESGWMTKISKHTDRGSAGTGESEITYKAGDEGARFILYAGEPQNAPIVSYGPFIADTQEDIKRLYHEYNRGVMKHINTLPEEFVARYVSKKIKEK